MYIAYIDCDLSCLYMEYIAENNKICVSKATADETLEAGNIILLLRTRWQFMSIVLINI